MRTPGVAEGVDGSPRIVRRDVGARLRRVAMVCALGSTIDWYDFFIYGLGAELIFGRQFFAELSPAAGKMAALATFGVGFLARPVGAGIWGHFGDQLGRRAVLVPSLLLMGAATVGIGLLPGYASIGLWAPVVLVMLRLVQGLSVGGLWSGAVLLVVEHTPAARRGWYTSFVAVGAPAGFILAQLAFFVGRGLLSSAQFVAWGWRIPFLASIMLVVVGSLIWLRVPESPVFRALSDSRALSLAPLDELCRHRGRELVLASLSFMANATVGCVFMVYLMPYGTEVLKLSPNLMLVVLVVGAMTWLFAILGSGAWSDRFRGKVVYLAGLVVLVAWAVPLFLLVDTRVPVLLIVAVIVLGIGLGATHGPQPALFAGMFEPKFRYSGVSLSFAMGAMLGAGVAPFIATVLRERTGTSLSISAYLIVVGLISLAVVPAIREPRADHP